MVAANESIPHDNSEPNVDALRRITEDAISRSVGDVEQTLQKRRIDEEISQQLPAGAAFIAFVGQLAVTYPENPTILNCTGTFVGAVCTAAVVRHVGYRLLDKYWPKKNVPLRTLKKELKDTPGIIFGETPE